MATISLLKQRLKNSDEERRMVFQKAAETISTGLTGLSLHGGEIVILCAIANW